MPTHDTQETRASLIGRLPSVDDVAAWDEFVRLYGPVVRRTADRLGMQTADADDLLQEVFSSVARSIGDWLQRSNRGRFRFWLESVARHAAINLLTRRSTRPIGDRATAQTLPENLASVDPVTEAFDVEYRREIFLCAADAVRSQVADATWRAFELTHLDGQPIADAAAELGVSEAAIYVSRSRVMSRLRANVRQLEAELSGVSP